MKGMGGPPENGSFIALENSRELGQYLTLPTKVEIQIKGPTRTGFQSHFALLRSPVLSLRGCRELGLLTRGALTDLVIAVFDRGGGVGKTPFRISAGVIRSRNDASPF